MILREPGVITQSSSSTPPSSPCPSAISSLFAVEKKKGGPPVPTPSMLGKGFAPQPAIESPCSPDNGLRIIRLGQVGLIGTLQYRAAPITVLQRLGIAQAIISLSNCYFKFKLSPDVSDIQFQTSLKGDRPLSDFTSAFTSGTAMCLYVCLRLAR